MTIKNSVTQTNSDEERYRQLIELSPIPMAIHVMGTVVLANKAAAQLIGVASAKNLIGLNVLTFVHADSRDAVQHRIHLLNQGLRKATEVLEEKLIRHDGTIIDVEIVSMLINYNGKPSIQLVLHDITEKLAAERRLKAAKELAETERKRLHDLYMQTPAMIAILKGPDLVFELANPVYLSVTGRSRDIIGKSIKDAFPEFVSQGLVKIFQSVYSTGKPYARNEMLIRIKTRPNHPPQDIYFNLVCQPIFDPSGEVEGILLHSSDVTSQVQTRVEIEEREKQYRSIFDSTHDAIIIFDSNGHILDANAAAVTMHGYTNHEIINKRIIDLLHPEGKKVYLELRTSVMDGKIYRGVGKHIKKDGSVIVAEITGTAVIYKRRQHIMVVVRDVTERKQTEEELSYTNELLSTVTDNASLGLLMLDSFQHCTFINAAAEKIIGYTFEEIHKINKPLHDIIHHTRPDGTAYSMEDCPIDKALPQDKRQMGEDIFVRPDGSFYPVRFVASPLIKQGRAVGTVIELEDLTEYVKAKKAYIKADARSKELESITKALKEQQTQLLHLNKSKDEFISLASHQLRTPATGVKQYIAMALDGYGGAVSPQLRIFLERAYESNERQLVIVNDLLRVAQVDAGKVVLQKKTFDISSFVERIVQDATSMFNERKQTIECGRLHKDIKVKADKERLRMVIENIIDNASKYTQAGKTVRVEVRQLKTCVRITVKDEGVGIKKEDINKIFGKFIRVDNPLSTKVGGTGIGLYWAEKIISLHGGKISVRSTPGLGSAFNIDLPVL